MKTGLIVPALVLVAACTPGKERTKDMAVDHVWIRLAAVPANPSAAYFQVHGGPKDETLTGVSTGAAMRSEMHESKGAGGVSSMAPVKLVAVRAGSDLAFAPGGKHVMLFGLDPVVKAGATVPMTFTFASGRKVIANARVLAAGDAAPGGVSDARPLTPGEIDLARGVFGDAIDYASVRVVLGKWVFFQPRDVVMSPVGRIHFHPHGTAYRDDFSQASLGEQGLFVHEMTHIWQYQSGIYLPLRRMPWARYDYTVKPGWTLKKYGLEQQAEIVRHAYLHEHNAYLPDAPPLDQLTPILPFHPSHPADHGVASPLNPR